MPITKGQGNPDWTREETVLALDLLRVAGARVPGKTSREVRELSGLLLRLPIHPQGVRNARFRNVEGVYLKLQNLTSLRPDRVIGSVSPVLEWIELYGSSSEIGRMLLRRRQSFFGVALP